MKLSILVPVFGEEETVEEILLKVDSTKYPIAHEIIVVNDGSTDGTLERIESAKKKIPDLKIVSYSENRGKGYAIREGIAASEGDVLIIQDADLEYDPAEIPQIIEPILAGETDVVYGSRFLGEIRNISPLHLFGNRALTFLTNILFNARLTDMETCYKAFSRKVLDDILIMEDGFDIEPEITVEILKKGYDILEVPVTYEARGFEEGKKITWREGLSSGFILFKHRFPHIHQFFKDYPGEVILRIIRQRKVMGEITRKKPIVLDIGCGFQYLFLQRIYRRIGAGYGFDLEVKEKNIRNLELRFHKFTSKLPYPNSFFDYVTSIATFERFDDTEVFAKEAGRILKKGGRIIVTTPKTRVSSLRNLLAASRIIEPKKRLIKKRYYEPAEVEDTFKKAGFKKVKAESFELGYNMLYVFQKK